MHKNQKLAVTAAVALALGFGAFKALQDDDVNANGPLGPTVGDKVERQDKVKQELLRLRDVEAPKELQKVNNALNKRFKHLGGEMLASASVDAAGETIYFASKLSPGRAADGTTIWSQAIGRSYKFEGEKLAPAIEQATTMRVKRPKGNKSSFFIDAMRNTDYPSMPSPKKPAGQK